MKITFGSSKEEIRNCTITELINCLLTTDGSGVQNKSEALIALLLKTDKEIKHILNTIGENNE